MNRLKELRREAGYTQEQMAEMMGVKTVTYGTWERGTAQISLAQALRVADILACSLDEIAGRADPADHEKRVVTRRMDAVDDEGRRLIIEASILAERLHPKS